MTGHTNLGGQDEVWARAGVKAVMLKPLNLREVSEMVYELLA